jgi:hypothetical protein
VRTSPGTRAAEVLAAAGEGGHGAMTPYRADGAGCGGGHCTQVMMSSFYFM